jgi:hypothetical protein
MAHKQAVTNHIQIVVGLAVGAPAALLLEQAITFSSCHACNEMLARVHAARACLCCWAEMGRPVRRTAFSFISDIRVSFTHQSFMWLAHHPKSGKHARLKRRNP